MRLAVLCCYQFGPAQKRSYVTYNEDATYNVLGGSRSGVI